MATKTRLKAPVGFARVKSKIDTPCVICSVKLTYEIMDKGWPGYCYECRRLEQRERRLKACFICDAPGSFYKSENRCPSCFEAYKRFTS